MAKKSDHSLFINSFFNSLKILDYLLIFRPSLFTIHYFGSLFTIHYKKGHYSLIMIPHPDPQRMQAMIKIYQVIEEVGVFSPTANRPTHTDRQSDPHSDYSAYLRVV